MARDPVCGMEVDERAGFKTWYRGKMYHFCSAVCMRGFRRHPWKYLKQSGKKFAK